MSVGSIITALGGGSSSLSTKARQSLPRRIYRFRTLGMGLASLPMAVVLSEITASAWAWAWVLLVCLVWPHLAYALARSSSNPFRTELRNLVIDSAIVGACVPIMHFNLLPSAVLLSVTTADKVNSGVRGLWIYALPGMLIAPLVVGMLTGFDVDFHSSTQVIIACLPVLVIHTLAVSISSYRLVRRLQMQNLKLETISRVDSMTGLLGRGHWEEQAESVLQDSRSVHRNTLMAIDIDHFKEINDHYGHAVGDDALRAIADVVRSHTPPGSHAGRLGGDEFAVVLPLPLADAELVAEKIRVEVESLKFPMARDLKCTVSIGFAEPPARFSDLRGWLEHADRALYRAKQAGRNRIVGA
jgi:diguanylate cyclase